MLILVHSFFRQSYQNTKNRLLDFHFHVFRFCILQGQTGLDGQKHDIVASPNRTSFLPMKTLKNCPQNQHTYGSLDLFFSPFATAQTGPDLKIHIRNVVQDTFSKVLQDFAQIQRSLFIEFAYPITLSKEPKNMRLLGIFNSNSKDRFCPEPHCSTMTAVVRSIHC